MMNWRSERHLAAVARALLGPRATLTKGEYQLLGPDYSVDISSVELRAIRARIKAGHDPLGEGFAEVRSASARRNDGAVYTPTAIVGSMVAWARDTCDPTRIVDPGAGSGRFILRAAGAFPRARLVAIEKDPLAALMLRANAVVFGVAKRLHVIVADYRDIKLPQIPGTTLFIGNPPYVRHHDIETHWKAWFSETAGKFGVKASTLAGLHIHFFVQTLKLACAGDAGVFVTSAEWLDVNYGHTLRLLLAERLGGIALYVLEPTVEAFPGTTTTAAITCFKVGARPSALRVHTVKTVDDLNGLTSGRMVGWERVSASSKWSTIVRPGPATPAGHIELGELFRVHRGQVTGSNNVWIAGAHTASVPNRFLTPTVTKARDLLDVGDRLMDAGRLRRVVDLPLDLETLDENERQAIEAFLDWARTIGAHETYVAKHRKAWWSVGLRAPAPILCTYMARRAPLFSRNLCAARHINIAHGLYPRNGLDDELLDLLVTWLNKNVSQRDGRTYAGGLTKFEPKEIERLCIPPLEDFRQ